MSKMVLLSVYLDNGNQPREAEKNLGLVNTRGGTQLLQIKGKANTIYRLVDEQTGQVVKKQFLLLKGKKLQVVVDQTIVVEIDNFFPDARSSYGPDKDAPAYVVDTGIDDIQLGLMSADSPGGVANSTRTVIDLDGAASGTITQTIWLDGVTLATNPDTLKANGVLIA